jgi:hypothetical protein
MKFKLAVLMVIFFSLSARAEFRRLTDLVCTDDMGGVAVRMHYDSAKSPYVPQLFTIYGQLTSDVAMVMSDNILFTGKIPEQRSFEFQSQNKKKYEADLKIDGKVTPVECKVKTRFRL